MEGSVIKIRGARVHNLKNIDVDIPKNKLVVITGISGSGKSSLAFDTLYAEGQRRYVESLSAYARQFLGVMQKPDVDKIEGISPAISIDQRKSSHNPRSTVGTITEIYDYLRLLFARIGKPHCPKCGKLISRQTIDQITEQILKLPKPSTRAKPRTRAELGSGLSRTELRSSSGLGAGLVPHRNKVSGAGNTEITILGPVVKSKKGEHQGVLEEIQRAGFVRVRIDGIVQLIQEAIDKILDKKKKHDIEVVVDRLIIDSDLDRSRLVDSLETALKLGKGVVIINQKSKINPSTKLKVDAEQSRSIKNQKDNDLIFSEHFACDECGISLPELEPRLFSFNSPFGACPSCQGLGEKLEVDPKLVIPNPNLTLAEGAVFPWAHASHKIGRQGFFWWKIEDLSQRHNFSVDVQVKELSKQDIDLILYGDGDPRTRTKFSVGQSSTELRSGAGFEGVIPWLERRYHETESDWAREEIEQYMVEKKCEVCQGKRLKPEVLAVKVAGKSIDDVVTMSIDKVKGFFEELLEVRSMKYEEKKHEETEKSSKSSDFKLQTSDLKIAQPIIKEILNRLQFLIDVGLDYLTLNRRTDTLAGGEEQRIRLATQIGSKLTGVLYILDEPSVGLHARDQNRLIETLKKLRDIGNSVIVVEHDPQTIREADWVIDVGPGAGKRGGRIIFTGTPKALLKSHTLTGEYLSGRKKVEISQKLKVKAVGLVKGQELLAEYQKLKTKNQTGNQNQKPKTNYLIIKGATEHNLKNIDVKIPLAKFVCVTGVSGSGKSTLVNDILARALFKKFYNAKDEPGSFKEILGLEFLNKVVLVDQSPIGRTPRSNPATYTGVFSYVRDIFAKTREARIRGYQPGRFSFNVKGGRCEACEGQGVKKIEMYFLPDVYVECQECKGKRFNLETLSIEYKGKNIAEVLEMTIEDALEFFKNIPGIYHKLKTLNDVGLGYMEVGQSAPSLSGGEAQRVKLATELSKKATGNTLYILDEPTTGLHFEDIKKLISVLKGLVDKGNTVLVIEHNLDVIKNSDWVIDLGPEGGEEGGKIVSEGTVLQVVNNKKSYTGQFLKKTLK